MGDKVLDVLVLAIVTIPLTSALGVIFWPRRRNVATLESIRFALPFRRKAKR